MLRWLLDEQLNLPYNIISNIEDAPEDALIISYGEKIKATFSLPDSGLLWQMGVQRHELSTGLHQGLPAYYMTNDWYSLPFDLFSMIFFCLSRYEEYYSYTPDKHGRYPAIASIQYQLSLLQRPVLDEWVAYLRLQFGQLGLPVGHAAFGWQPSYDIDIAYSHQGKGIKRIAGAFARDLFKGNFSGIKQRTETLGGNKDPYDAYELMQDTHKQINKKPLYFILAAAETTDFDKNIPLSHPLMQELVKRLSAEGEIGIHPSYFTDVQPALISNEKQALEQITAKRITRSRQHYIKLTLPDTYRRLISCGIEYDYSMGYGSHLGFRAGTGESFFWYDLEREFVTDLRLFPFCFMDTTAMYEEQLSVTEAFERLSKMTSVLKRCGSTLITVFHNFSLGTAGEWHGWPEAYQKFAKEI